MAGHDKLSVPRQSQVDTREEPSRVQRRSSLPDLPEPPIDPLIGTVIDRYEIKSELGRGGMGVVYLARQVDMNRDVAIKVLMKGLDESPTAVARFRREAEATHRIESPHIVKMYGFGRAQDLIYTAMELIDGETLGEVLARGRLTGKECIRIATEIATALVAAHSAGVVHRDLKPDNIMLCAGERKPIKVLDFGIAKMLEPDLVGGVSLTNTGALIGTPKYMSPEAANGAKAGAPADLYALGVILFEMLTGTPPFLGETLIMLLSQHCSEPPPSPIARDPELEISDALTALIERLLSKSAEERPTAQEALAELLAMPNAASVSERSLSLPPGVHRASHHDGDESVLHESTSARTSDMMIQPVRSPRRGLWFAVFAVLSVLVVAAIGFLLGSPGPSAEDVAAPIGNARAEGAAAGAPEGPAEDAAEGVSEGVTPTRAIAPGEQRADAEEVATEAVASETVADATEEAEATEEGARQNEDTASADEAPEERRRRRRARRRSARMEAASPEPAMTDERPRSIGTVSEWR